MTREEAKRILYVYRAVYLVDANHREAFDMAIKALEQEPKTDVLDKISAEIEETYINISYQENKDREASWGLRKALQIIDKYKTEIE